MVQIVQRLALLTKRKDVTQFVKRACGEAGSITVLNSIHDFSDTIFSLLLIDATDFLDSDNMIFFDSKESQNLLKKSVCILPGNCSAQISFFAENYFNYIIPFPIQLELFLTYCTRIINQLQSEKSKYISYKADKISVPESINGLFYGESNLMKNVRRQIIDAAYSDSPVLLIGETGTGKTTAANAIHSLSDRRGRKIVPVSLSTVVESLAESSFLGYSKGAFTSAESEGIGYFEAADGSTLFLDELGTASTSLQAMLLTFLDNGNFKRIGENKEKHVDVRMIFATNADLKKKLNDGSFRFDFYNRINDIIIKIPPLRAHKEDIRKIVLNFFDDKSVIISEDAMELLENYNWPGNIRELHKCLKRALTNAANNSYDGVITSEFIDFGDLSFPQ